jgi:SPP1 gp7 family putative phage head morphogenesis protein
MAKRDRGHEETEDVLKELEKRITAEYKQAEKEIQAKLDDYLRRFEIKDQIKKQAVLDGKISEDEYKQWRLGQVAIGERWKEMRDTIAEDLTNAASISKSIANGYMPEVYAINHNYGTFQVEKESKIDTSYTLYDRDSVQRLFDDENTFYHKAGKKLMRDINEGKQMAWDKKAVQSAMTQSLLQGESIGKIATRLSNLVANSDRKAMIRNARTITTGIENAGRIDSYKRAEAMGIPMEKEWLATLDGRTRHEHRMLDGMHVPVDEKFEVEGYEIEYPGDPSADDGMVYNCRCTLIARIKDFEHDLSDMDSRISNDEDVGDMTYDEWKESRDIRSDSITKQDEIAIHMQNLYNAEYARYAGQGRKGDI